MENKIESRFLDRTGKEIKKESFVLISTINYGHTSKLRVGYVKNLNKNSLQIRTICDSSQWWKAEPKIKIVMGVVDLILNYSSGYINSRFKDILVLENPSDLMTEHELNFAKSKGWL